MSDKSKVINQPIKTVDLSSLTVDDAVNALIPHLPQAIQEFLREMELQEGASPVDYILGYINRHYETGELSYRQSEGMTAVMRQSVERMAPERSPAIAKCKQCGADFLVERLGQLFCPDPPPQETRESCGSQWNRAERIRQAEARGDFRYSRVDDRHLKIAGARAAGVI